MALLRCSLCMRLAFPLLALQHEFHLRQDTHATRVLPPSTKHHARLGLLLPLCVQLLLMLLDGVAAVRSTPAMNWSQGATMLDQVPLVPTTRVMSGHC
jgi:hypothetical protein